MDLAADLFAKLFNQIGLTRKQPMSSSAAHLLPPRRFHFPERAKDRGTILPGD